MENGTKGAEKVWWIMPFGQSQIQQIKRDTRRREIDLGLMEISSTGTRIAHGLRMYPKWVQLIPNGVQVGWCYYQKPDSTYIYVKAETTAKFFVTVGG